MLSLDFVLEFCHGIAKGGDCKAEFNQPSCWLYSVSNLLVFLVINNPVFRWDSCKGSELEECEEMLKIVQRSRDSQLDLAGGLRLQAAKC